MRHTIAPGEMFLNHHDHKVSRALNMDQLVPENAVSNRFANTLSILITFSHLFELESYKILSPWSLKESTNIPGWDMYHLI